MYDLDFCDKYDGQWFMEVFWMVVCVVNVIIGGILTLKFWQSFGGKENERDIANIGKKKSSSNQNDKVSRKIEKKLKILGLISIIIAIFTTIWFGSRLLVRIVDCKNTSMLLIFSALSSNGGFLSSISVFIIFGFRLLYCFEDTTYAVSKVIKLWFFGWMGITCVMSIISLYYYVFSSNFEIGISKAYTVASFTGVFCIINCYILLLIFVNKLSLMIKEFVNQFGIITDVQLNALNKTVSSIQIIDDDEITLEIAAKNANLNSSFNVHVDRNVNNNGSGDNMRKLSLMIRDMSKYSILMSIVTIGLSFVIICTTVGAVFKTRFSKELVGITVLILQNVNMICVALQFYFFRQSYNKYCSILHKHCESRYTTSINTQLSQQTLTNTISNTSFLQLKQIDRQGTIGIERVVSSRNLVIMDNNNNDNNKNDSGLGEQIIKNVDNNPKEDETLTTFSNEPNLANANMKSFSEEHLE